MLSSIRLSKVFTFMGGGFILAGLALQNFFEYALTIGWVGGLVSLLVAVVSAYQHKI